jgi:hypothetical protein
MRRLYKGVMIGRRTSRPATSRIDVFEPTRPEYVAAAAVVETTE